MNSQNVYLILDFMFLYIILHEIYMINTDPITFFKNFLYIKDADHSSPKLLLITMFLCYYETRLMLNTAKMYVQEFVTVSCRS